MHPLFSYLSQKKILILGLGREGRSSLDLLRNVKLKSLGLADQSVEALEKIDLPEDYPVKTYAGDHYLEALEDGYDLVFKAPGISLREEPRVAGEAWTLKRYPKTEITGQADLFLRFSTAQIVGISGTKGKSTTTSLLYDMFDVSHEAYLRGNIGIPPLQHFDAVEGKLCALELSCHQLEFVRQSPEVAILTNLYPDHLDHYRDYEHYLESKLHLIANPPEQGMTVITTAEDPFVVKRVRALLTPKHKIHWLSRNQEDLETSDVKNSDGQSQETCWYLADDHVLHGPQAFELELPQGPGLAASHLLFDAALAAIAAHLRGIAKEDIAKACAKFKGLPHRCEKLGTFAGRTFYNDSIATIPHATLLAIEALNQPKTLIVGGLDRGLDYSELIEGLEKTSVRKVILLPETGQRIGEALAKRRPGLFKLYKVNTMAEAVKQAYAITKPGETILFSPAAASYHAYKNFAERGDDFRHEVEIQGEKIRDIRDK